MSTSTSTFEVACEGPALDYTARVNLHHAEITVIDGGEDGLRLRLRVSAMSGEDAVAGARRVLRSRPYFNFSIARAETPVA